MFRNLRDWLSLADYESAKESATSQVVSRFARGNVSVQNGWYIDEAKLSCLLTAGDLAMSNLASLVESHSSHAVNS